MDTEINYKYKDGYHDDIKEGHITLDKSIYKDYTNVYKTDIGNSVKDDLARRLWNCHLISRGDHECRSFLTDIINFLKDDNGKYCGDEELMKLYEFLMKQELVEILFECY